MSYGGVMAAIHAATANKKVAPSITYIFRDAFTTPEVSPIASPRTCQPGPGSFTVTFPTGSASINASGQLELTGANDTSDTVYSIEEIVSAAGRILCFDLIGGTAHSMNGYSTANSFGGSVPAGFNFLQPAVVDSAVYVPFYTRYASYAIIRTSAGIVGRNLFLGYDGTHWKLLWESRYYSGATYHHHILFSIYTNSKNTFDNVGVYDLPAPWNVDYGIATIRIASPTSGVVTASTADSWDEFTWTAKTNEVLNFKFRYVDVDNCWILRCDQAAGTIKLFERAAGTETERDAGKTQTWTNNAAYRIVIIADGVQIMTYVDGVGKHNFTSDNFQATATGIEVDGFTVGANLICYPRVVPNF